MGFLTDLRRRLSERGAGVMRREPRLDVAGAPDGPNAAALDRHQAVIEADPYSFQVSHRRMAWLLRLSAMTNIGLLASICAPKV